MIRKGKIEDIEAIVEYNWRLAYETENMELNKERLTKGVEAALSDEAKGIYFVYVIENKVVGQMMITKEWSDWRNGEFWWIQSVYVHNEYRRQRIYRALFEHVKALAEADNNICGLRLYVEKENEIAKHTYKTMGMEETYYLLYEIEK